MKKHRKYLQDRRNKIKMKKENILFLGEELCYSIRKANQ